MRLILLVVCCLVFFACGDDSTTPAKDAAVLTEAKVVVDGAKIKEASVVESVVKEISAKDATPQVH